MEEKKSLFSIRVDDVVIQQIFKKFEDEIRDLRQQVKYMSSKIDRYPSFDEMDRLKSDVEFLKKENCELKEVISGKISTLEKEMINNGTRIESMIGNSINDAIISVNNVVRAQNAIIEQKVLELTKPSLEFTEMKNKVMDVMTSHQSIREEINFLSGFMCFFVGYDFKQGVKKINISDSVQKIIEPERLRLFNCETNIDSLKSKAISAESLLSRVFASDNDPMPQLNSNVEFSFTEKPKLPRIKFNKIVDFGRYLVELVPVLQGILSAFYHQIMSLSNSTNDRSEFLTNTPNSISSSTLNEIQASFEKIKNNSVSRDEFHELENKFYTLREQYIPTIRLQKIHSDLESIYDQFVEKPMFISAIEELKNDFQRSIDSKNTDLVSKRSITVNSNRSPIKTSITPRGNTAHSVIYGDTYKSHK